MESFFSETMLPGNDVSGMLMSPGANKQDVIRFDKLMQGIESDGIRIVTEPGPAAGQQNTPRGLSFEALDTLEKIQATTQNNMGEALRVLEEQKDFDPIKKDDLKQDAWGFMEKMHQTMRDQATRLLKAQMHMNIYSVTVSIVNRVANNVNEGIKTLYRQQG